LTLALCHGEHQSVRSSFLSISFSTAITLSTSLALCQTAPPSGEDPQRVEEARTRYREGLNSFQRRQFAEATVSFERSFRLRPHPFTLYNAAEARMRAGDNVGALQQLRDLLAMTDPAPDAELQGRARALAQQMGEQNLTPTPVVAQRDCPTCPTCPPQRECPTCPPAARIETRISPVAWGLAGASLVFVGVGSAFLGVAVDNANTFTNDLAPRPLQEQLRDQGETYRIVGIAGLAVGVGAAVGAVWMFTHPRAVEEPAPAMARMQFGISPNGLAVAGTF
jgi:hypothetical protein